MSLNLFLKRFLWYFSLCLLLSCTKTNEDDTPKIYFSRINSNISYATSIDNNDSIKELSLDLYYPDKTLKSSRLPMVLLIHGGSYLVGSKNVMSNLCKAFSDSGFIAASIDYRLGWNNSSSCNSDPDEIIKASYRGIQDAKAALRFLVSQSTEFGLDTNWIFIGGYSAGGSIALNSCYVTDAYVQLNYPDISDNMGKLNTSGNLLTNKYVIKGILNAWGAICDSSLINSSNALPTISFHGLKDHLVYADIGHFMNCENFPLYFGSLCIERQLQKYSVPNITHILPDAGHEPLDEFSDSFIAANTACFFHRLMNQTASSGEFTGILNSCR